MRTPKRKHIIELILFLAILGASFLVFKPLYAFIEYKINEARINVLKAVEEQLGISVHYQSMSPSLLRTLSFKNLKITDVQSGKTVVFCEELVVDYDLFALLLGPRESTFRSVLVKNGKIHIDPIRDKKLFDFFRTTRVSKKTLFEKKAQPSTLDASESQASATGRGATKESFDLGFFLKERVPPVLLHNITLVWSSGEQKSTLYILQASAKMEEKRFKTEATTLISYSNADLSKHNMSADVHLKGEYNFEQKRASAHINLNKLKTKGFDLNGLRFNLNYENNALHLSMGEKNPHVSLTSEWDFKQKNGKLNAVFQDFEPFTIVTVHSLPKNLHALKKITLSGQSTLNFSDLEQFNWQSALDFGLPEMSVDQFHVAEHQIHLEAKANEKELRVKTLSLKSLQTDIRASLTMDLKKLRPKAFVDIRYFNIPNLPKLKSSLHIYSKGKNIFCKSPLVQINQGYLKNVLLKVRPQHNKIDLDLFAEDSSGRLNLDGSYTFAKTAQEKNFLEIHSTLDSIDTGNLVAFAPNFENESLKALFKTFQLTTELYFSTDFSDFSYNVIKVIVASKNIEDFYGLFSLAGNRQTVSIKDILFSFGDITVRGGTDINVENTNSIFFKSYVTVNSIAYNFNGIYENNALNISGDYGLLINALKNEDQGYALKIQTHDMPIAFLPLYLSLDSTLALRSTTDWQAQIQNLTLTYNTNLQITHNIMRVIAQGTVTPQKTLFPLIKFENAYSALTGSAEVVLTQDADTKGQELVGSFSLLNPQGADRIEAKTVVSVPDVRYSHGSVVFDSVALNRFFAGQTEDKIFSARGDFYTEPDNIFVQFDISKLNALIKGTPLDGHGTFLLDNDLFSISNTALVFGQQHFNNVNLYAFLNEGKASFNTDYAGIVAGHKSSMAISVVGELMQDDGKYTGIIEKLKNATSNFSLSCSFDKFRFDNYHAKKSIPATLFKESGVTAFYGGAKEELTGFVMDDGLFSFEIDQSLPIHLTANGTIASDKIDSSIKDIFIDVGFVSSLFKNPFIEFTEGALLGSLDIKGTNNNPEFYGALHLRDTYGNSPGYAPERFGPANLTISAKDNIFTAPYTIIHSPAGDIWGEATAEMLGWNINEIFVHCGTVADQRGFMRTKNPIFHAEGKVSADITMDIYPGKVMELNGKASFDDGYFLIPFNEMIEFLEHAEPGRQEFKMNLAIGVGQRTEFRWPTENFPIIRTLLRADKPVTMVADTEKGLFAVDGNLKMQGGEVLYVKRNFYIREGSLVFRDGIYGPLPRLSIRAEIRDQDQKGEAIRIRLVAKDQLITEFLPILESDPPRSTLELQQLLGQVAIGDISRKSFLKDTLISSTDLLTQIGVFRKVESKVRDWFRLDAFSFRTMVLQNAIFGNLFRPENGKALTIGNYFDNTSVYFGKYFGSAIYLDALLHMSYYDTDNVSQRQLSSKKNVAGNLLFVPELGLEMDTPFFSLRWSLAPNEVDSLFVGDSALKLLWKYSY